MEAPPPDASDSGGLPLVVMGVIIAVCSVSLTALLTLLYVKRNQVRALLGIKPKGLGPDDEGKDSGDSLGPHLQIVMSMENCDDEMKLGDLRASSQHSHSGNSRERSPNGLGGIPSHSTSSSVHAGHSTDSKRGMVAGDGGGAEGTSASAAGAGGYEGASGMQQSGLGSGGYLQSSRRMLQPPAAATTSGSGGGSGFGATGSRGGSKARSRPGSGPVGDTGTGTGAGRTGSGAGVASGGAAVGIGGMGGSLLPTAGPVAELQKLMQLSDDIKDRQLEVHQSLGWGGYGVVYKGEPLAGQLVGVCVCVCAWLAWRRGRGSRGWGGVLQVYTLTPVRFVSVLVSSV